MANDLTPDIYDISGFVNTIHKKFNDDLSDETLAMGMYGYIEDIMARIAQNSIVMATEWGNEAVPNRSKFEKTILSNAIAYDIQGINAIPAKLNVMLGFVEEELIAKMGDNNYIILDSETSYMIEDYEFHLDYDLQISRTLVENGEYAYSARYIIKKKNPLSDITNPYLSIPIKMTVSYSSFIFISCSLHQVNFSTITKTLTSDVFLDNKTFDFEFENQLAYFDVDITENDTTTNLTPYLSGMPPSETYYCYYSYLDESNIRVKLDKSSYEPRSSAKVEISLYTTLGADGNFSYTDDVQITLSSTKYNYDGLMMLLRPVGDSYDGVDRKSADDLKLLIPKERLSRGTINNNKDLENYFFNMDNTRLYFYKKRSNQFERLYYAYMIMQDNSNNIIPTNTLSIKITSDNIDAVIDSRNVIQPGKKFIYNDTTEMCEVYTGDDDNIEDDNFVYTSPFSIVINESPYLTMSYYSTNVEKNNYFEYTYINEDCPLQFICNYIQIERHYLKNNDSYVFTASLLQNILEDFDMIQIDTDTNKIVSTNMKIMLLITNDDSNYYIEGEIVEYDSESFIYKVQFTLHNDSVIDKNNNIRVNEIYKAGDTSKTYAYLNREVTLSLFVYYNNGNYYGNNTISYFGDTVEGYSLSNIFKTKTTVELYHNYSENIRSTVNVAKDKDTGEQYFIIKSSPLIRHSYMQDITRNKEVLKYLNIRKVYIDDAVDIIEDSFSVDLKFFNTYGRSNMFIIGHNNKLLDRINLTLNFRVKLLTNADENVVKKIKKSIKEYVENINEVASIHMNNLTAYIKEQYSSNIEFIEFVGINDYDATYQYLEKIDVTDKEEVPEFINLNLLNNTISDINIETV